MCFVRLRRPIIILAALVATALTAPIAAGSDATVSATMMGGPDPVTVGHTAAFTTTFTNTGPVGVHDVELRLELADGATFVQAIPGDDCVLEHGHTVECKFGMLGPGGEIDLSVLMTAPSTPGTMTVTSHWQAEHADPQFPSATIGVVPPSPDALSEWVLPAGDTVTTDPGSGATTTNPQVTTAEVPATDIGTSTELSEADAAPGQFCAPYGICFGQVSTITIGSTFDPGNPLRFVFVLDKSEIPKHTKIKKIPMYHDSVAVANCTGSPGVASPDPCVVSRKKLKKGDVQIVVLSSTNGRWRP
ncbi:MAG: hypothetical protein ACRDY3_12435 [Acidimicrobiales bacterium]